MIVAAACLVVLTVRSIREHVLLVWLCVGCFAAGVLTLTMTDKYVMAFSAPVCLLVAALLAGSVNRRSPLSPPWQGGVGGVVRAPACADAVALEGLKNDLREHQFQPDEERRYAPDPAAARKDTLDPRYRHPADRIVVRR